MSTPCKVVVADCDELRALMSSAVLQAMLDTVPDAIREANLPKWLSREQAKHRYGLTNRQLTYLRHKRRVEFSQHGRRIWYLRESMDAYFEEGRVTALTEKSAQN